MRMRSLCKISLVVAVLCGIGAAQGAPPQLYAGEPVQLFSAIAVPPEAPMPKIAQMKALIKTQMNRAIDGKSYPSVLEWQPLTTRQKFDVFLHSTYAPSTFLNAGISVVADRVQGRRNPEYEIGMRGWGQHYGIELATSETDVFLQRFFFPTLLKQDPRYYREPNLPFFRRALYSVSRILITRTDSGGETLNTSRFLAAATSRALSDLYVPGQQQGLRPLSNCVSFNLLRDAGMNLVHEFWPDFRHKFLHR
jgi:hypothetical protein